jgi:hypothetical protein
MAALGKILTSAACHGDLGSLKLLFDADQWARMIDCFGVYVRQRADYERIHYVTGHHQFSLALQRALKQIGESGLGQLIQCVDRKVPDNDRLHEWSNAEARHPSLAII